VKEYIPFGTAIFAGFVGSVLGRYWKVRDKQEEEKDKERAQEAAVEVARIAAETAMATQMHQRIETLEKLCQELHLARIEDIRHVAECEAKYRMLEQQYKELSLRMAAFEGQVIIPPREATQT
jgi:regulator of PEP synthase PpsR (kinase-PPPase family)